MGFLVWTTWACYVECDMEKRDVEVAGRELCKKRHGHGVRLSLALYYRLIWPDRHILFV